MIHIASEGDAIWGIGIILHIFKLAFPGIEVELRDSETPQIIARTLHPRHEYHTNAPYFTWCGESCRVPLKSYRPLFELLTVDLKLQDENVFCIPYLITVYFELQTLIGIKFNMNDLRLDTNRDRPYFLAYAARNRIPIREQLFALIRNKDSTAHGIGMCSTTPGFRTGAHETWRENYKHLKIYRFAFAMENTYKPKYVTEKILNCFLAGAIPIYYGDHEWVKEVFNEKAIIFVQDFNSLEECADYIIKVDRTPALLKEYQDQPVFIKEKYRGYFDETHPCDEYKQIIEILHELKL